MRSEIELQSICYERLLAKDESEIEKLVEAVTSRGVFFLDTSGPSAAGINSQIPQILEAQYEFFQQPLEYQQTFEVTGLERGYRKCERPDMERLSFAREVEINGKLNIPNELHCVSNQLANVTNFTDTALRDMYRILCQSTRPIIPTADAEDPRAPSYTNLTLDYSLEEDGVELVPEYADSGLITLLYYNLPSLEILDPVSKEWDLVQPRANHQVVYIGKHLSAVSGGRFKAVAHRVVNPGAGTGQVAYLLHPNLDYVDDPNYVL